ncbi:PKD domain-containing protein [Marinobacterium arenosum]|uniref:PKD domain-containing protein n=1 Tax=Marinobacterium arenosum TaxID=2862496 RepID=UPI001C9500F3|nr:PKD domain-containing protein [Marinobacterium arenosum]MBY4675841.1 PKD domain-containing protein [Marinobacterium arenosum]
MHSFTFSEADIDYLRVDGEGGIYYSDTYTPEQIAEEAGEPAPPEGELAMPAMDDPFSLHSKPGSGNVVFLDFDGHQITNTAWNSDHAVLDALPFDLDGDPASFNADERNRIAEIWSRVAEDLAPFDIDVTTEAPASFGPNTGRILITEDSDASGKAMPAQGAGGVAYVGVWGISSYASYYSPALVYFDNLGNGGPTYVAEASSHEFGHNLGLSHDGGAGGSYYTGHGSGYISWAPIMGAGYYNNVTQWSKGDYVSANQHQDDLQIIDSKLGYRADDHGDDLLSASPLLVDSAGVVAATNPETDAYNEAPENKGIIERGSDFDLFYFDAGAGLIDLTVNPAWDAFYRNTRRGANLDIEVSLLDASGNLVAFDDPLDDTYAALNLSVPAGRYYLKVTGIGNSASPYPDYGSLGQYFIRGLITPPEAVTNQPPVAAFSSVCNGLACNFTDNSSDSDGSVQGWQWSFGDGSSATSQNPSHNYATAGSYTVTLTVTDDQGASDSSSQTVTVSDGNAAPIAEFSFSCSDLSCSFSDLSSDSDGSVQSWQWNFGDGSSSTSQNPSHSYAAAGSYTVTLTVTDDQGASDSSSQTVTVSEPPATPPGVPSGVSALDNGDGTATVAWQGEAGADSYEVQRERLHPKNGRWGGNTLVATVGGSTTSITDSSGSGTFRYRVRASNGSGSSDWSGWINVDVTDGSGGGGSGGNGNGGCNGKKKSC